MKIDERKLKGIRGYSHFGRSLRFWIVSGAFAVSIFAAFAATVCNNGGYLGCPTPKPISGSCDYCLSEISCSATNNQSRRDVWPAPYGVAGKDSFSIKGEIICKYSCIATCKLHKVEWTETLIFNDEPWREFTLDGNSCIGNAGGP